MKVHVHTQARGGFGVPQKRFLSVKRMNINCLFRYATTIWNTYV